MRTIALVSATFRADLGVPVAGDLPSLRSEIRAAEALVLAPRYGELLREVWPDAKALRWIHSLGAGVERLPFDLLRGSEVIVTNSRGVYAPALAEFVLAAILCFAKDLRRLMANQSAHQWDPFLVRRLEGATLGIIGYGSTGRAIAQRAAAFGMTVVTRGRNGGTPLDVLLASSDYVVLSAPLTHETRGLMSRERLAQMRTTAVLINVGRGELVDEAALVEALRENRIRGAALDVFAAEPLPPEHPLWTLDNVLISPHSADQTPDSHERAAALFRRNLERFERGLTLENIVDKSAGY